MHIHRLVLLDSFFFFFFSSRRRHTRSLCDWSSDVCSSDLERVFRTPHVPRPAAGRGFGAGLFPVHSPLLRESWLVSSPPLTNMLKFSGSPRSEERRVGERV